MARNSDRLAIVIVGAGNLACTLAPQLRDAGYRIASVIVRDAASSLRQGKLLAKSVGAECATVANAEIASSVVWFCVPDGQIAKAAQLLEHATDWQGRIALHSSGALTAEVLKRLARRGASVASAHPLMTFVRGSRPSLVGVPFAIEGDAAASRAARRMVRAMKAKPWQIQPRNKVAYHAWGTFASPLLTALLAATEGVARLAGVSQKAARERMLPMLAQTLANYAVLGAAQGFSGPLVRGDVETVRGHLRALKTVPAARMVYIALARAASEHLPGKSRAEMRKLLKG